jgi:restriction system protein
MARLWLVRLGRHGEEEARALAQSELVLGFKVGDLSKAKDRGAVLELVKNKYADAKSKTQMNFAAQRSELSRSLF